MDKDRVGKGKPECSYEERVQFVLGLEESHEGSGKAIESGDMAYIIVNV